MINDKTMIMLIIIAIILGFSYIMTIPDDACAVTDKYIQKIINYKLTDDDGSVSMEPVTYYCLNTTNGEKIVSCEKWENTKIGDKICEVMNDG